MGRGLRDRKNKARKILLNSGERVLKEPETHVAGRGRWREQADFDATDLPKKRPPGPEAARGEGGGGLKAIFEGASAGSGRLSKRVLMSSKMGRGYEGKKGGLGGNWGRKSVEGMGEGEEGGSE